MHSLYFRGVLAFILIHMSWAFRNKKPYLRVEDARLGESGHVNNERVRHPVKAFNLQNGEPAFNNLVIASHAPRAPAPADRKNGLADTHIW